MSEHCLSTEKILVLLRRSTLHRRSKFAVRLLELQRMLQTELNKLPDDSTMPVRDLIHLELSPEVLVELLPPQERAVYDSVVTTGGFPEPPPGTSWRCQRKHHYVWWSKVLARLDFYCRPSAARALERKMTKGLKRRTGYAREKAPLPPLRLYVPPSFARRLGAKVERPTITLGKWLATPSLSRMRIKPVVK